MMERTVSCPPQTLLTPWQVLILYIICTMISAAVCVKKKKKKKQKNTSNIFFRVKQESAYWPALERNSKHLTVC